jgi:DNA-binding SARP family transcriptional activator
MFVLGNLKPPYDEWFRRNAWDRYVSDLNEEGLAWWFNMETDVLAAHLVPLASASIYVLIPPRLRFLSEAVNMTAAPENLHPYYRQFLNDGDLEAAAAAAEAAVLFTFEMGDGFDGLAVWRDRIESLLGRADGLSALAIGGLWHCRGMIGACLESNAIPVIHAGEQALAWSQRAGANNLRAHAAIFHTFGCVNNAEFGRIESNLADANALCGMADISPGARMVLMSQIGVQQVARGRLEKSSELLKRTFPETGSSELPTHSKMHVYYHAVLHAVRIGDLDALHRLCGRIQDLSFPLDMPFHTSYLNFVLGIAFLNANEPERALFHVCRAEEKGRESKSPLCENHIAMLRGQVLSEMGELDPAERLLTAWRETWKTNGHHLYVVASEMEMAHILSRRGKMAAARGKFENAQKLWPLKGPVYVHARSAAFVDSLESTLFPASGPAEIRSEEKAPPILVQTFGELTLRAGSAVTTEREWKSRRAKQLLKALVVLGPGEVPAERLEQLLWPEAADPGAGLKAAVRRLREIGARAGDAPAEWIVVRNRRVSISPAFCRVDAVHFRERLAAALSNGAGVREIRDALDLYTDDFLKNDVNDAWIIQRREALKSEYAEGVMALADRCGEMGRAETAVSYLKKAIAQIPLHPECYRRLMGIYLCGGAPSKAHQVYDQAAQCLYGLPGESGREAMRRLAELLGDAGDFRGSI